MCEGRRIGLTTILVERSGGLLHERRNSLSCDFGENGAKPFLWEATAKRTRAEFFGAHPVSELWKWSVLDLENEGRLPHPMPYDQGRDRYLPISWDEAL